MTGTEEQNTSPPVRPVVLSVLCIITFTAGLFKLAIFSWAACISSPDYTGKSINGFLNLFLGISNTSSILAWLSVTIIAMAGAGLMWKMKKSGFYIYTVSVSIAYLLPAISSGADMMTIQRLFFTSVFIFLYGIHLKFMN